MGNGNKRVTRNTRVRKEQGDKDQFLKQKLNEGPTIEEIYELCKAEYTRMLAKLSHFESDKEEAKLGKNEKVSEKSTSGE